MLNVYGKQMNKILNFILNTYIPMAPKESVSFVTRLKLFIEKYKNDGNRLNIPEGKNFT